MESVGARRGAPEPTRDVPIAIVTAFVVLVLALVGARQSRLHALDQRAASDERTLGRLVAGVSVDLTAALDEVTAGASGVREPAGAGVERQGLVPADPATAPAAVTAAAPLSAQERELTAVRSLLERARDSASTQLGSAVELESGTRTLAVAPAFVPSPTGPPLTPDARRERLSGWFVAVVDVDSLARAHLPVGAVGSVREDGALLTAGRHAPDRLPDDTVQIGGRRFELTAGDPAGVPLGAHTIGLGLAGILGAPLSALLVLLGGRRVRRLRVEFARRELQVGLIGEVAPLVQQSLDLADVLPAVAVQLTDHFGLTGVRLSTGDGPEPEELFSLGDRPDPRVRPVLRPPVQLPAGTTLALGLQRGGRSVALLQLVGGRDLDAADLESLRALSELVAAAIVNASLYARQQQAMHRLRELDTMKTVFLSTASHELRTPATAIGGFASFLADSWDRFDDEQRRDFARRIVANARSLSGVVEDLLDFSLLDRGEAPILLEPVDLATLVSSVVDRLAPVLEAHRVLLSKVEVPEVAGEVNGLERVVTNLLTNAAKFSPAGSTISVSVAPDDAGGGATVVVSDEGPGVPEEDRQRVFTRFFRGDGDAVVQTRGVGIGLSVVAELVRRMHGSVELDDAPGGGARFTVRLPAAGSPSDQEPQEAEDASPT